MPWEEKKVVTNSSEVFTFGELLKASRKRRHLTQQQCAEALGMHRKAVIRWEQGDVLPASKTLVLELARQLHLDDQETRALLDASFTVPSPHWYVPLQRNPFFTGREEILQALHTQLSANPAVALTQSSALSGLGGVGKTQIALEYAYRHALDYSAVFWIGAETIESIMFSLVRIAEVLQLPDRGSQDQQRVLAAVQRWLATHHNWLLIWDNLEALDLPTRFLPTARKGMILLTTRRQAIGTLARGVNLESMGEEEAILFLLRRAKVMEPEAAQEHVQQLAIQMPLVCTAAQQLVTEMGRFPLAIDQAGAYIEETGCSVVEYLHRYTQKRYDLLARRGMSSDHPYSVVATLRLACQRVGEQHPAALELLHCCAFLSPDAIPEELLLAGADQLGPVLGPAVADEAEFDHALTTLRMFSLIQRHPDTRMLSVHRLVQVILQEELSRQDQEQWHQRVVQLLATVFPTVTDVTVVGLSELCERLLPHVMTCAAAMSDDLEDQALAALLLRAANYVQERFQYELAESLYQRALQMQERISGPEHPNVAAVLERLAIAYRDTGNYEQAEPLFQSAVRILDQALGPERLEVASPLAGLAKVYREQGKLELAKPLYQRALSIREQSLGPEHPLVARSLNQLGLFYTNQGNYELAEAVYQRALSILEQASDPEYLLVAYLLNNLGNLYTEQGKFELAEPFCQRAVRLVEQILGSEHADVASMLDTLAALYRAWGRYELAEPLYQRALRLFEPTIGPTHGKVAGPLNGLAVLCREQGNYGEAEALFHRALRIREQHLGANHPETAQTLHDLAILRKIQGNLDEASSLTERALAIRSASLGDSHPKTLATRTLYDQLVQSQAPDERSSHRCQQKLRRSLVCASR